MNNKKIVDMQKIENKKVNMKNQLRKNVGISPFLVDSKNHRKENKGKLFDGIVGEIKKKKEKSNKNWNIFLKGNSKKIEMIRLIVIAVMIILVINLISISYKANIFKVNVITSATNAYQELFTGGINSLEQNFEGANLSFNEAANRFMELEKELKYLKIYSGQSQGESTIINLVNLMIETGKKLSKAGKSLIMMNEDLTFLAKNIFNPQKDSLTEKLKINFSLFKEASKEIREVANSFENIKIETLPEKYREKALMAKKELKKIKILFEEGEKYFPTLLTLLGDKHPQRFLFLFQNKNELRPTGGFIGSLMIMDINDGYITKMDFKDVYDYDGQFYGLIEAPEELQPLTKYWRLRDSNISPDFIISAKKAAWFLEQETGPGVDHVIALDQTVLETLLEITGPIKLDGIKEPLSKENFDFITSYIVESKLMGKTTPKNILKKLIEKLKDKFKNPKLLFKLLPEIKTLMEEKHFMLFSFDEDIQTVFNKFKITGEITELKEKEDYLNITHISIGGNKSDAFLEKNISHNTFVDKDGSITNEITIETKHTYSKKVDVKWREILNKFGFYQKIEPRIKDILGRHNNLTMFRVYVPRGSRLISTEGINKSEVKVKFDKELNKTYFLFRNEVKPGEEKKVEINYILPFKLDFNPLADYRLIIQKQAGREGDLFKKSLLTHSSLNIYRYLPLSTQKDKYGIMRYETKLKTDEIVTGVIGR